MSILNVKYYMYIYILKYVNFESPENMKFATKDGTEKG